jgi:hypothetical protein
VEERAGGNGWGCGLIQRRLDLVEQEALRPGLGLALLEPGDGRLRAADPLAKDMLRLTKGRAKPECARGVFHEPH